jgi:hypothetical protein
MKYFIGLLLSLGFYWSLFAQNLQIIPEVKPSDGVEQAVTTIANSWWHVWDAYNQQARVFKEKKNLAAQLASWVFTWDTLLDYLAYLIKFLSEIWIFVGACFIVYAGYLYATNIFTGKDPSSANKAISNAVIGVLVITFSYAIMKAIVAAFLT